MKYLKSSKTDPTKRAIGLAHGGCFECSGVESKRGEDWRNQEFDTISTQKTRFIDFTEIKFTFGKAPRDTIIAQSGMFALNKV